MVYNFGGAKLANNGHFFSSQGDCVQVQSPNKLGATTESGKAQFPAIEVHFETLTRSIQVDLQYGLQSSTIVSLLLESLSATSTHVSRSSL